MKYFSMLIKPASSICNMRCRYCFYYDVAANREEFDYGMMDEATSKSIIDKCLNYFKEEVTITFAFQGGEPTCAGLDYFKGFIDYVKAEKKDYHHIKYAIQTNGILVDQKWVDFFKENAFLVGVSLDGYRKNHNYFRLSNTLNNTYDQVISTLHLLEDNEVDVNVLCVLTSQLAKSPNEMFNFIIKNKIKYLQLIPCLPPLESDKKVFGLTPKLFYSFYNTFFDLWYAEFKRGHYISVTLFDNLIPMFAGVPPMQCGYLGHCSMQFIVEANGNVYPCDFYVLDKYLVGNINLNSIDELISSTIMKDFIHEKKRTCSECPTCPYLKICNGQCKRLNVSYFDEHYCGYKALIIAKEAKFSELAKSNGGMV